MSSRLAKALGRSAVMDRTAPSHVPPRRLMPSSEVGRQRKDRTELSVHGRNGQVRVKWSFGDDPRNIPG